MAHLDVKVEYWLQLTSDEFRLVSVALCGDLSDVDLEAGIKLNQKLQGQRVRQTELAYDKIKRTAEEANARVETYEKENPR